MARVRGAGAWLAVALAGAGCGAEGVVVTGEYRTGSNLGVLEWAGATRDVPVEVRGGIAGLDRSTLEQAAERGFVAASGSPGRRFIQHPAAAGVRDYRVRVVFGAAAAGDGLCRDAAAETAGPGLAAAVALCYRGEALAAAAGQSAAAPVTADAVARLVSVLCDTMLRVPPPRP